MDIQHQERPGHLYREPSSASCASAPRKTPAVQAAATLTLLSHSESGTFALRVITLMAGAVGEIIPCRSLLTGQTLYGKVVDNKTLLFARVERKATW